MVFFSFEEKFNVGIKAFLTAIFKEVSRSKLKNFMLLLLFGPNERKVSKL